MITLAQISATCKPPLAASRDRHENAVAAAEQSDLPPWPDSAAPAGWRRCSSSSPWIALTALNRLVRLVPNGSVMIYMYPTYIPVSTPKNVSSDRYGLFLYHEGWKQIDFNEHIRNLNGVPVLFIPGNGGSYKQIGGFSENMISTVGFNMRKVTKGNVTIKLWDLGGQPIFRSMWERYYCAVSAIVHPGLLER